MEKIPLKGSKKVLRELLENTMQCKLYMDIRWESECILFRKKRNIPFTNEEMNLLKERFPQCLSDSTKNRINMVSFFGNQCLSVSGIFNRDMIKDL